MKKKPIITQDDLEAFHAAVKGTRRIQHDKVSLTTTPPPRRRLKQPPTEDILQLNETLEVNAVGSEAHLTYHQPGISHKTLRNLRKGQYNVDAVLDLHGMTVSEAKKTVDSFLRQSLKEGDRVVLIIHGKGRMTQSILKNKLNQWLRGITAVLAFCSASTPHGSRGAMYILLRRTQGEK